MAEPEVVVVEGDQAGDEEMGEAEGIEDLVNAPEDDGEPTGLEDIEPTLAERTTFLEYDSFHRKIPISTNR